MPQNRYRNRNVITDAVTGDTVDGVSNLDPPPSLLDLVQSIVVNGKIIKDNKKADAEWKKWLNLLYEYIGTLTEQVVSTQAIKFGDSPSIDAFARARVSNPETIFDSKQIHDKQPLFWDEVTTGSGAAGTWSQDTASTVMDVDLSTAGSITRQTFRRFNYQPGKSQLILVTFVLDKSGGGTGIVRRVGLYDGENGIFLEDNAGTISLVRRSNATGTPVNESIAQADWNIDVFDGTGASGVTLDWAVSQIMIIDMEWLGVGRVRVGFVIDGIPYYAHQFVHANSLSGVYMSTPNLPIRFYISNGGTGAASTLEHICCSVMSEGGTVDLGTTRNASNGTTAISAATSGTIYGLVGVRLDSAKLDGVVKLQSFSIMEVAATSVDYEWQIIFNPTIASGSESWSNVSTIVEKSVAAVTLTGGTVIASGYVKGGKESGSITAALDTALQLGSTIAGVADRIYLAGMPLSNNASFYGSINWKEIS